MVKSMITQKQNINQPSDMCDLVNCGIIKKADETIDHDHAHVRAPGLRHPGTHL